MSEISDVLSAIATLDARGERMALATIVSVRGSTYRRAGARLLVPEHGQSIGNVSGGCLEGDVERLGREVMASGAPRLAVFDLSAEGDEVWGFGLGCNGVMELFIEPAEHAVSTAEALRTAIEDEEPCVLVTVIASTTAEILPGARLLLRADGRQVGSIGPEVDAPVLRLAPPALESGRSSVEEVATPSGTVRVFVEVLRPPPRVIVCGAGHDAIPVVRQAAELGWRVEVADVRRRLLTNERFPEASGFHDVDPERIGEVIRPGIRTAAVVMTHNYLRDHEYLRGLLGRELVYLGMLGPRKRTEQLLGDLAGAGIEASPRDREVLHGPAGLDLGAEGPEEVATAIVAELLAVLRGRAGGSLRERVGPIHDQFVPV